MHNLGKILWLKQRNAISMMTNHNPLSVGVLAVNREHSSTRRDLPLAWKIQNKIRITFYFEKLSELTNIASSFKQRVCLQSSGGVGRGQKAAQVAVGSQFAERSVPRILSPQLEMLVARDRRCLRLSIGLFDQSVRNIGMKRLSFQR